MERDPSTIVAHDEELPAGAVVPPIFQTSLFTFASYQELEDAMAGRARRPIYSRGDNPTVQAFEAKVAALEGAGAAHAFASGMATISAAVLSNLEAGERVVAEDARFSREQAEAIAEAFADATTGTLASKADVELSTNRLRAELQTNTDALRTEIKTTADALRAEMRALETTLREARGAFHRRVIGAVPAMLLVHLMGGWGILAANLP